MFGLLKLISALCDRIRLLLLSCDLISVCFRVFFFLSFSLPFYIAVTSREHHDLFFDINSIPLRTVALYELSTERFMATSQTYRLLTENIRLIKNHQKVKKKIVIEL